MVGSNTKTQKKFNKLKLDLFSTLIIKQIFIVHQIKKLLDSPKYNDLLEWIILFNTTNEWEKGWESSLGEFLKKNINLGLIDQYSGTLGHLLVQSLLVAIIFALEHSCALRYLQRYCPCEVMPVYWVLPKWPCTFRVWAAGTVSLPLSWGAVQPLPLCPHWSLPHHAGNAPMERDLTLSSAGQTTQTISRLHPYTSLYSSGAGKDRNTGAFESVDLSLSPSVI